MINDNLFVYIIKLQNPMLLAEKKINQILEIVKIMQQERSGGFLVLLSIDTDIPVVFFFFFFFLFFSLLLFCVCFCWFFICFFFLFCLFCLFYFLFLFSPFFIELRWLIDCYLTPSLQYCSYIITRTSYK